MQGLKKDGFNTIFVFHIPFVFMHVALMPSVGSSIAIISLVLNI